MTVSFPRRRTLTYGYEEGKRRPTLRFWNEMAVPEGIHGAIQDAKYQIRHLSKDKLYWGWSYGT